MTRCPVFCLVALLLTAAIAAADTPPNLLVNPSFETLNAQGWAKGWQVWPTPPPERGAVTIDQKQAHTGRCSLRISQRRLTSYSRGEQTLTVEPNQQYVFTAWIKGDKITAGGGSQGARLYVAGLGGKDRASKAMFGTFDWQQLTVGPYSSGKGGQITVMCYLHMASGTVWFDDLQAFKVTPEWEKHARQEKSRRRLQIDLDQAEAAARAAGDPKALAELQAVSQQAATAKLPEKLDFRAGPPYFPLHREVFAAMARLNARRLPGQGPLITWAVNPFAPLPVLGLIPRRRQPLATVTLGVGERDQAALNLCNLAAGTMRLHLRWSGFKGAHAPVLTLREAIHVQTPSGRLVADPLPRLRADLGAPGSFGMTLAPGIFRQLWLDVSSAGAVPGIYEGTLTLSPPGVAEQRMPVRVRVLPVTFPQTTPIATWNYSYQTWPLLRGRWPQAIADLRSHHINSYCWPAALLPWPKFDQSGALEPLDWTTFDKALAAYGPVRWLLLWPGFEWPDNLQLRLGLKPGSQLWEQRFIVWFRALIAGLKQRGFGYDRVAWYLSDEPCSSARATAVALAGRAVHKADPRALIVENPYSACTQALLDRMAPVVDIWCPSLTWAKGNLLHWFQQKSKLLWSYQVLSREADPFTAYRLSFWRCWQQGMTGQGFWDYADAKGDNWDATIGGSPGFAVVYGGDPAELIPSKRWEAWREGTEDYTYMWLLQQASKSAPAAQVLLHARVDRLLAKPSPEALQALRNQILAALVAAQ